MYITRSCHADGFVRAAESRQESSTDSRCTVYMESERTEYDTFVWDLRQTL